MGGRKLNKVISTGRNLHDGDFLQARRKKAMKIGLERGGKKKILFLSTRKGKIGLKR